MVANIYISNNLFEHRNKNRLTLRRLAKISGVSKSEINRIENNGSIPRVDNAIKLAKALDICVEDLFTFNI